MVRAPCLRPSSIARGRGDGRNLQHRHDHGAFGDPALGRVDGGRVHQFVGAHVEDDEILALVVEDDEADAGRALVAHRQMSRVDPLRGVKVGGDAGELVRADHRHQRRMCAEPRRADRLVGALAARPHVEIGAEHRLAEDRQFRRAHRQADREASDDGDLRPHANPRQS